MTTAARPTFEPAKGGSGRGERDLSALSRQYSSRDLPAHTKLKYREHGQTTSEELRGRDFRRELEEKERAAGERSGKRGGEGRREERGREGGSKRPRIEAPPTNLDADDAADSDSDSDADSDDDNDALMAELEQIRNERRQEEAAAARQQLQTQERIRMENIVSGNPLLNLNPKQDMKVRRRWDEDVVFKNCAAAEPDTRYYVNDSLRSEFHKRFMDKYVK